MARKIIDIGTIGNDGTGDSIRDSFRKVNDNFKELYASLGLGEKLTFKNLDDTPDTYEGQIDKDISSFATSILTVNNQETGIQFKKLLAKEDSGITIDWNSDQNEISIINDRSTLTDFTNPDPDVFTPIGSVSLKSGANQYRIKDLPIYDRLWKVGDSGTPGGPNTHGEATSKSYVDSFVSRAGIDHVNPTTGNTDSAFGRMSGPLILSRDPVSDDDELYDGLIAATKRYVDKAAFGSTTNIYVSTVGNDGRTELSRELQGSSLAYAFKSIEAALKRAEEIILESPADTGPYKKILSYGDNPSNQCTLDFIAESPDSGEGFDASVVMTLDSVTFSLDNQERQLRGVNYYPGDVLEIPGGDLANNGGRIKILVLTTDPTPGSITSFRVITGGSYTGSPGDQSALPVNQTILTTDDIIVSGSPIGGGGAIGQGAAFDFVYKVNGIQINNSGSGYGLVSVRITGGGGSGAFGTADVVGGEIVSITITDQGSGFTNIPEVIANLPRFCIFTDGQRTDYTGNVLTSNPATFPGRDIREGLYLKGERSGAIAQILRHDGELGDETGVSAIDQSDPGETDLYEFFDVDIQTGEFEIGEPISYGDITIISQVSVLIESGVYEENFPLKVSRNVAIIGDEFRRVIIKPKSGMSSSPWAFTKFRRDLTVGGSLTRDDGLTFVYDDTLNIADRLFGYHYLENPADPVYPKINNRGFFRSAAYLLEINKTFIQEEVVGWIDQQIQPLAGPPLGIWVDFEYNRSICRRDVGLLIDAMAFDLKYGEYSRTVSAALKYYQNASGIFAITPNSEGGQLEQTIAALERLNVVSQYVLNNLPLLTNFQTLYSQTIDPAFISESGSSVDLSLKNCTIQLSPTTIFTRNGHGLTAGDSIVFDVSSGGSLPEGINFDQVYYVLSEGLTSNNFSVTDSIDSEDAIQATSIGSGILYFRTLIYDYGAFYELVNTVIDVIQENNLNRPKNNDELDIFLCNDANIVRAVTCQGHGGFMMVLDPVGQILTKSPYAQESASFSKSINKQTFAGGQFVDGFAGNLQFKHQASTLEVKRAIPVEGFGSNYQPGDILEVSGGEYIRTAKLLVITVVSGAPENVRIIDPGNYTSSENIDLIDPPNIPLTITGSGSGARFSLELVVARLAISDIDRFPQLPSSFIVNDTIYRINYVRDYIYSPTSTTATLVLDQTTPFPFSPGLQECTISVGNPAIITKSNHGLQKGATIVFSTSEGGSLPGGINAEQEYYVLFEGLTDNTFRITATPGILTPLETTSAGDGTFSYQRLYEIITPGNRSMLSNDYTQINDLGYGLIAANGGLIEAVSVFTYYCWISYYSINGGQIRSVAGSSAHGKYGLIAEGSDPLELPTPASLWEELSQGAEVFWPDDDSRYANSAGGTLIWVTNYSYIPLGESELEIDHPIVGLARYTIGAIEVDEIYPGVTRLSITTEDGLIESVPKETPVTIRCLRNLVLTGDLIDVAVRPSTGLIMNELPDDVYRILQFDLYYNNDFNPPIPYDFEVVGPAPTTILENLSGPLRIRDGYEIYFSSSNTLPGGLEPLVVGEDNRNTYFVIDANPISNTFKVATSRNGDPITLTDLGSGTLNYFIYGLTTTRLRENYRYINLNVFEPGEFSGDHLQGDGSCSFPTLPPGTLVVSAAGHTLIDGDVIKFEVDDNEIDFLPDPLVRGRRYHVRNSAPGTFEVSLDPPGVGTSIVQTSSASGTFYYGKILGNPGDNQLAITTITSVDQDRIIGSEFVFLGEKYEITDYETLSQADPPSSFGSTVFGLITLDRPFEPTKKSPLQYSRVTTLYAGGIAGKTGTDGSLTVRISLTRVTGHDLLDIGTGSYKETNYPNEIYGKSELPVNELEEVQERTVGRVFFVTTDQFGNFKVGPFFKVDQGTGTVTFSSNIAISNLDGLGFKRGVTVSEFSTDTGLADNAIDKVPVEFAVRTYIDRRLGITHIGDVVSAGDLIPPSTGGFLDLQGQQPLRGNLNLNNNNITNLANPILSTDAVNRQFLKISNLSDVTLTPSTPNAGNIITFTGTGSNMVNVSMTGDISLTYTSGNTITAQLTANSITNADVNTSAGIVQSKLSMNSADTFVESTGWAGAKTQADLGLAKFSGDNFETSGGFVRIKNNGVALAELQNISSGFVLGNNSGSLGPVQTLTLSSAVEAGFGIQKTQWGSLTGFIRKSNEETNPSAMAFTVVDMQSTYDATANNKLVQRNSLGDFGGRQITVDLLRMGNGLSNNELIVRTVASGTGGDIRYYGYNQQGGFIVGSGSNSTDKITKYLNDTHSFRNSADNAPAPITASQIQVTAITTGGSTTSGTITGRWTLTGTSPNESRLQATYSADLAEYYEGDQEYEVGTVLIFGGDREVTITGKEADTRVAGVVSNTAAFVMYDACPGFKNLVALQGRVPCRVVGKIQKGDLLVTSKIQGVAITTSNAQAGTIIGKALENYDSDHIGMIEIAVGRH